jgi:hypothetical protein
LSHSSSLFCVLDILFIYLFIYLFIFAILGFELRAYILSHSPALFFCEGLFKIGSFELFIWAGLEL